MMDGSNAIVVITGIGAVTPLGADVATTWQRLIAGADARAPITLFDVSGCRCRHGAQARIPELPEVDPRRLRRWSRATRLAAPAFREALAMAALLDGNGRSKHRQLTLSVSTTGGAMALGERFLRGLLSRRRGPGRIFDVSHYQGQHQLLDLQDHFAFRGPVTIITNTCAGGANAIGHAADLIRAGQADLVVTGGYEPLTELIFVGFDCLQAMSTDQCRPFDTTRSGLMLGEAAAFLVLESEQRARQRGAKILGVLAGYGHGTDLYHLTQPHPRGAALVAAMRQALARSGVALADVGYLNAHGTGTPLNDASECVAFSEVFGANSHLRLSSTKGAIGHTLGAAGAIEAVFALQALTTGDLPPNLHVRQPEPTVASQLVTGHERAPSIRATMSVNLGFGGPNAALVFARYVDPPAGMKSVSRSTLLAAEPNATIGVGTTKFPRPLAICGTGVVLPEGEPKRMAGLAGHEFPVRRVDVLRPELARWQKLPSVRRASPLTLFMIEAAQRALDAAGGITVVKPSTLGIVAAYHTGTLVPTGQFFQGVVKNGQRFGSPNVFPETVFNAPTSHLATALGVAGPAYSVLSDDTAWVAAINVAATWLANRLVEHVLVVAGEELDPMAVDAYATVRWLRRNNGFVPAEGAGALVLRAANPDDPVQIIASAEGFTHRNKRQSRTAAEDLFSQFPDVRHVGRTAAGTLWDALESEIHKSRGFDAPAGGANPGAAFVASAAWHTVSAAEDVRSNAKELLVPIWGHSQQHSALLLAGSSA
ncbi:MAG TPA: beta-ketoacyl-[acyl-carrier-protein] synthase family protein [Verrucomicrobiae bacterium]|nr:beta-ketoacyl-[acyl-carrier-protein] synthase family protein [Verrucomicrobiae bacterium]